MIRRPNETWQASAEEVTPQKLFLNRRKIIASAGAIGLAGLAGCVDGQGSASAQTPVGDHTPDPQRSLDFNPSEFRINDPLTPYDAVTGYNNFYEFGLGKTDPARHSHRMTTAPWSIEVEGLTERPGAYALEDLVDFEALEERIYRLRCVEAWSMVVPWIGVPLASIIERLQPSSSARYVTF